MASVAISIVALVAAGCGGGSGRTSRVGPGIGRTCRAVIGVEVPRTGQMATLGGAQLAFAKLATANDNEANGTQIALVQANTQPTSAMAVTQQLIANPAVVAVVGPADSDEVEAVGPLFGRAGMAFISASATKTSLTDGANPTFFRVVAKDSLQGPTVAHFVIDKLRPRTLIIIDDQVAYVTGLVNAMIPMFRAAGIAVARQSVGRQVTDFSPLVAKIPPRTTVAVLPWLAPASAQQFGKTLAAQHDHVTIVGTDRLYSPGAFTVPGSYVSSFGPDITSIRSDASLVKQATPELTTFGAFGPPAYAATHVIDEAVASVCRSGQTPTRSNLLPAIKATNEPAARSALGQAIRFDSHGDLIGAKWFLLHINSAGRYVPISGS